MPKGKELKIPKKRKRDVRFNEDGELEYYSCSETEESLGEDIEKAPEPKRQKHLEGNNLRSAEKTFAQLRPARSRLGYIGSSNEEMAEAPEIQQPLPQNILAQSIAIPPMAVNRIPDAVQNVTADQEEAWKRFFEGASTIFSKQPDTQNKDVILHLFKAMEELSEAHFKELKSRAQDNQANVYDVSL